jgi:hypothetical protein
MSISAISAILAERNGAGAGVYFGNFGEFGRSDTQPARCRCGPCFSTAPAHALLFRQF